MRGPERWPRPQDRPAPRTTPPVRAPVGLTMTQSRRRRSLRPPWLSAAGATKGADSQRDQLGCPGGLTAARACSPHGGPRPGFRTRGFGPWSCSPRSGETGEAHPRSGAHITQSKSGRAQSRSGERGCPGREASGPTALPPADGRRASRSTELQGSEKNSPLYHLSSERS